MISQVEILHGLLDQGVEVESKDDASILVPEGNEAG